jgi:hypothetical protein
MKRTALALIAVTALSACSHWDNDTRHHSSYDNNQKRYLGLDPLASPAGQTGGYFNSKPHPERGPDSVMYDPRWDNFRRGRNQRN